MTLRLVRRFSSLVLVLAAGLIGSAGLSDAAALAPARPPVVLFAVPGLTWADVTAMPQLQALASRSAVGELSVKTRGQVTSCAAGLLAVSAGDRTTASDRSCRLDMAGWPLLRASNVDGRYDTRVGGLGSALQAAGVRTVAVGQQAVPLLADFAGSVDDVAANFGEAVQRGGVIGVLDSRLYAAAGARRVAARVAVDADLATVVGRLPAGATLMVAGVSDLSTGGPQLHALVLSGPAWAHTELRSSAAGRAPYVQLIDVAPTLLTAAGARVPAYMVGRPMQPGTAAVPAISKFVDDNHHAVLERTLGQQVFLALGVAAIVMMVLAAGTARRGRQIGRGLARLIAPAPMLAFVGNAFPWWRWSPWAYGGIVLAGCLILAVVTSMIARRHRVAAIVVVPIVSIVVLAVDQLAGSPLQLSSPLGDSPLAAGRFSGMGNLDFAILAASALLVAGIAGGRLSRAPAVLAAGLILVVAIVVDGAPGLGNDIGGVLALVPAGLVLLALVADVRITRLRAAGIVVMTIVVAVGVALADYSRPPTAQTHVGRFVGQILHGGAGTEVHRKLDASLASFGLTVGTFVVGFALVLAVVARHRIRAAVSEVAGGPPAVIAVGVVAVLGVALNDSGITIAAMAAIVATSAFYGAGPLGTRSAAASSAEPADAIGGATG